MNYSTKKKLGLDTSDPGVISSSWVKLTLTFICTLSEQAYLSMRSKASKNSMYTLTWQLDHTLNHISNAEAINSCLLFFSNIIRFVINGHRKKINARPWQSSKTHSLWGSADRQLRADLNSENKADRVHVKTNSRSIFHVPLKMSLLLLFFERTCWRLLFMLRLID